MTDRGYGIGAQRRCIRHHAARRALIRFTSSGFRFMRASLPRITETKTLWPLPEPKRRMVGNVPEIVVGRQHCQLVMNAKLSQESVDGCDLHSVATASISQFGRLDMIV